MTKKKCLCMYRKVRIKSISMNFYQTLFSFRLWNVVLLMDDFYTVGAFLCKMMIIPFRLGIFMPSVMHSVNSTENMQFTVEMRLCSLVLCFQPTNPFPPLSNIRSNYFHLRNNTKQPFWKLKRSHNDEMLSEKHAIKCNRLDLNVTISNCVAAASV